MPRAAHHDRSVAMASTGVPPGHLGDEAMPVVDDVRRRRPLVGPPLSHHAEGDGVERARLDRLAESRVAEAAAQLAGGLTGERQRQRVAGVGGAGGDPIGDAAGEHAGLARSGGGDDGDERRRRRDRRPLFGVEVAEQRRRASTRQLYGGRVSRSLAAGHRLAGTVCCMPYPKKLLNDYEELAVDLHPHWLYFFEAVFALIAAIVLGIVVVADRRAVRGAGGSPSG